MPDLAMSGMSHENFRIANEVLQSYLCDMEEVYRVSDPRTLKAVAHPLRTRLLAALRADGPATATELGARFGESSGSTSYHLRQLARYGFVEEDADQRDKRERRWRARHRYTSWSNTELETSPEGRAAAAFLRHRQLEALTAQVEAFERARATWNSEWIEAAGMSDQFARLTPGSILALYQRIEALVNEYAQADEGAPDAQMVHLFVAAHPRQVS